MLNKALSPEVVDRDTITLDGRTVPYTVKRSHQARHIRLEVRADAGLVVTVPGGYSVKRVPDLLKTKQRWILRHCDSNNGTTPRPAGYRFGDSVQYLGQSLQLVPGDGAAPLSPKVVLEGARLVLHLPATETLEGVLVAWYRAQARHLISARVCVLGLEMGAAYRRITIRGQRTRWGSCSRKGNLSFNWHLMMLPGPVIDYVIIHELAHLKEMNHSTRFWGLVARYCPDWRTHRAYLRKHEVAWAIPAGAALG